MLKILGYLKLFTLSYFVSGNDTVLFIKTSNCRVLKNLGNKILTDLKIFHLKNFSGF